MSRKTGLGGLELILGIVLVLLGIYSFARPEGALTGAVICYGTVAVVTGVADILFYMKMEQHMGISPTVSRFLPDHARGVQHCACGQQAWL